MIVIIIWVKVNLALVIPARFCILFNLVHEGQDNEEEESAEHPLGQPFEGGAADVVSGQAVEDEVDKVQDEADSSQHDIRFYEADVPLKYKDIFIPAINRGFKYDNVDIPRSLVFHVKEILSADNVINMKHLNKIII